VRKFNTISEMKGLNGQPREEPEIMKYSLVRILDLIILLPDSTIIKYSMVKA
jgi:hypothetical protein